MAGEQERERARTIGFMLWESLNTAVPEAHTGQTCQSQKSVTCVSWSSADYEQNN